MTAAELPNPKGLYDIIQGRGRSGTIELDRKWGLEITIGVLNSPKGQHS